MADTFAKLRSDIEIRAESSQPQSSVVVKDPVTRGFYRFTWIQAVVLRHLDGRNSALSVARAASEQCGIEVTPEQVEDFTGKLGKLLLLDDMQSWARLEQLSGRKRRLLDSLLSIKIHAFNPDALLTGLDRRMGRFLFGAGFQSFAWLSIGAGIILSILNWDQLFFSLPEIFTLYSIPLILVVAFVVMTLHEFAHGVVLKHFGGRVEEMGFLFLYGIPALYCNVSDAWLLRKRERMLVSAAGGYIQAFVWAWATIFWRLLSPETVGSRVCLIAIAFSGIQAMFNFNPLIRLDGYYLLSDFLEVPNLRQKAFGYLRRRLRGFFTGARSAASSMSVRERRIFSWYGIFAFIFSAGLIGVLLARIGSWMIGAYRAWGVVLFSLMCLVIVPRGGRNNAEASGKTDAGTGSRTRKAPLLLVMLAVLIIAGFFPWELKVTGDFTIEPNAEVQINSQVEGTLRTIYVDEGSPVSKGAVLAEIQNLDLSDAYEEAKGELAARRASLRLLEAGYSPEEIERARRMVATRKTDLDNVERVEEERKMLLDTIDKKEAEKENARKTFERSKILLEEGLIARIDFDRDQTSYLVREKELAEAKGQLKVMDEGIGRDRQIKRRELEQAQSELNVLLAGSRKESIQEVEADVAKLEEKLNILEQQLRQLKIRSPIDGVVATPYLKNRIGEYLDKGDPFCRVVDDRMVIVDMPIPEKEIADVSPGLWIVLKARPFPKRDFQAQVKSISPVTTAGDKDRNVIVRAEMVNTDGTLKAGMTGVGKILCGQRMIMELVTRRMVRWLRTEFWEILP